jgi:23S rRNA (cytosine1962-C5)-methyltransferase
MLRRGGALSDEYQLLDFGAGRKLERFGRYLLDRPSPAAEAFEKRDPSIWNSADARFECRAAQSDEHGDWLPSDALPPRWTVECEHFRLELKPTPFGHLGVFPEQNSNWQWLREQVQRCSSPPKVLNLFAYTGASTLALAAAGAHVVHVDSAGNTVDWARRNAELSNLAEAPIRWIVEDALRFVRRECRRGNRYDAVVLDPPSFGRGPRSETWKLERDLPELLRLCGELTQQRPQFLLLSCHTPGVGAKELELLLVELTLGTRTAEVECFALALTDQSGRSLPSGIAGRIGVES